MADIDRTGNKIFTGWVMKTRYWLIRMFLAAGMVLGFRSPAEETATVQADRVNVRGLPSLGGEVITQLKKGETIAILEAIPAVKPKVGEPTNWFRIRMPANTPVWVNATFLDRTNKTVKARKLNIRSGPGENYSVIGLLLQGDTVKEIRAVEDWMEIEAPKSAYAFVASEYIQNSEVSAATAEKAVEPEKTTIVPPVAIAPVQKVEAEPPPMPPTVVTVADEPAVKEAVDQAPPPTPAPAPAPKMVPPPTLTLPPVIIPPPVAGEAVPERRVVTREGIVRSTFSIQAPTYYELVNPQTRKTINYLFSPSTNIVIKEYRGQKVLVTGEEFIDSRWTNTPVLNIQTLEPAP